MQTIDVLGMQQRLAAAGHSPGNVDGILGRKTFDALFRSVSSSNGKRHTPALARAAVVHFPQYEMLRPLRLAHFLAQAAHETGGWHWLVEIWGPTQAQKRYEGRKDLGNNQAGDGYAFRGRGIFQLTGRANYERYSNLLGLDLVEEPELAAHPGISLLIACKYWQERGINDSADRNDLEGVTRKINGGTNGIESRAKYLDKLQKLIGY